MAAATDGRQPRINFLTDPYTSRDLFGVCRGRCKACGRCGRYLKATAEYTVTPLDKGRKHPDNDARLTDCSRCGCPADVHEVVEHEQAREQGNDAFALGQYDAAVAHYSRALQLLPSDAAAWSNRAAAYLAKGWYPQALHDAEHAISLRPDWAKAWGRKAAAHQALGQHSEAAEAFRRGVELDPSSAVLREGLATTQRAQQRMARATGPQPSQRARQQGGATVAAPQAAAGPPVRSSAAAPPANQAKPKGAPPSVSPPSGRPPINAGAHPSAGSSHYHSAASTAPASSGGAGRGSSTGQPALATEDSFGSNSGSGSSVARSASARRLPAASSPGAARIGAAGSHANGKLGLGSLMDLLSAHSAPPARTAGPAAVEPPPSSGSSEPGSPASPARSVAEAGAEAVPSLLSRIAAAAQHSFPVAQQRHSASVSEAGSNGWGEEEEEEVQVEGAAAPGASLWERIIAAAAASQDADSHPQGPAAGGRESPLPAPPLRAALAATEAPGVHLSTTAAAEAAAQPPAAQLPPALACQWEQLQAEVRRVAAEVQGLQQQVAAFGASLERHHAVAAAGAAGERGAAAMPGPGPGPGIDLQQAAHSRASATPPRPAALYRSTSSSSGSSSSPPTPDGHVSDVSSLDGGAWGGGSAGGGIPTANAAARPAATAAAGKQPASEGEQTGKGGTVGSSLCSEPGSVVGPGSSRVEPGGGTDPGGLEAGAAGDPGPSSLSPGASLSEPFSSFAGAAPSRELLAGTPATSASFSTAPPQAEPSWVAEVLAARPQGPLDESSLATPSATPSGVTLEGSQAATAPQSLRPAGSDAAGSPGEGPPEAPPAQPAPFGGAATQLGGRRQRPPSGSSSDRDSSDEHDASASSDAEQSGFESEDEAEQREWLRRVEEARQQLAGGSARGILPPTSADRRTPGAAAAFPGAASGGRGGGGGVGRGGSAGGLDLSSLQSLVDGTASAALRRQDPQGVVRLGCKQCGPGRCSGYQPFTLDDLFSSGRLAAEGGPDLARLAASQRACGRCGCDCSEHETEKEAELREARELRAAQRAERLARQQEEQAAAASERQAREASEGDGAGARQRRVAAATARRTAAEEAGELLQTSDCDVLTQSRRGACGACKECPGFCLLFRASDANDPEVMFYCSVCGCRADAHEVDSAWARAEAERRRREEAAAQRAKQAQQAAAAQQSRHARQEAEAFEVLGLPPGADQKSITRAYKRLALQLHPDKQQQAGAAGAATTGGGTEDAAAAAAARFVRVAAAYKLLTEQRRG